MLFLPSPAATSWSHTVPAGHSLKFLAFIHDILTNMSIKSTFSKLKISVTTCTTSGYIIYQITCKKSQNLKFFMIGPYAIYLT